MKIEHRAWVLVMDGEKFLLLENAGDSELVNLQVIGEDAIRNPPTEAQGTDRPGRMADAGHGRSAVEQTDWHALEKRRFAADMADRLYHWAHEGRFSRLILAADPKSLGALRQHLHKEVCARIVAELDEDLTNHPPDRIEARLLEAAA